MTFSLSRTSFQLKLKAQLFKARLSLSWISEIFNCYLIVWSLMFTISIAQISIWIWSNPPYKFQRAQLNEVGLKEPCCRLGAQPLNTIHIWPWGSTAPQPDGLDWESILRREETGVPGENPRSQVEIDWNSIHIQHFCSGGGRRDWCPLRQPDFP